MAQNEKELKQLRATRGYVKASITRLYTFVSNEQDVNLSSVSILQSKRSRIVELFSEYETCNKQILALDEDDREDVADCEAKYFHILTILNEAIKVKATPSDDTTKTKAKLPTIQIQVFNGKYNIYTSRAYQLERGGTTDPTMQEFLQYLEKRALALESAEPTTSGRSYSKAVVNVMATKETTTCAYCAASRATSFTPRVGSAVCCANS